MKYVKCDLCGCGKSTVIAKKARIVPLNNVVCKKCGLVFINPRYTDKEISEFYTSEKYREVYHKNNYEQESYDYASNWESQERVNFLKKHLDLKKFKKKTILDVGCNTGYVLYLFKKLGWKELGIEPTKAIVDRAKKKYKIKIKQGFADQLKKEKFDIITYFHVLEHVLSPTQEMKHARKLLNDDGVLVVFVPDMFKAEGKLEHFFQHPHIYHFCPRTLELLMKKVGFKLVYLDHDVKGIRALFKKAKPEKIDFSKEYKTHDKIVSYATKYRKSYYVKGGFVKHNLKKAYHKLSPRAVRVVMKLSGKNSDKVINKLKKIKDKF